MTYLVRIVLHMSTLQQTLRSLSIEVTLLAFAGFGGREQYFVSATKQSRIPEHSWQPSRRYHHLLSLADALLEIEYTWPVSV